jgi:asparagine synthase (glutamine-hydrolysing)
VSEKVVAIAQGRSHFVWEIKAGLAARTLYPLVTKSPYGIGLRSPWTMQLAIQEAGLLRILVATIVAAATRPLGIKGMFYRVAGANVSAIDGPTEYSLYPSNVSAKLGPKNPKETAFIIRLEIESMLTDAQRSTFGGLVIIDANDIGRNILGNATDLPDKDLEEIFRDNPMGQGKQQTPVAIVSEK